MARCECACGCRADATGKDAREERQACDACYLNTGPYDHPVICGRRTEGFTRCHACHELISWGPVEFTSDEGEEGDDEGDKEFPVGESHCQGACQCGSAAWSWWNHTYDEDGPSYDYTPSEETEGADRDAVEQETAVTTTRGALGLIARDWARRSMVVLLWVTGGTVILALLLATQIWNHEINVFLAFRPTRLEVIFWCVASIWVWRMARDILRRRRRTARKAAHRRVQRERTLEAAWAVLRPEGDAAAHVCAKCGQQLGPDEPRDWGLRDWLFGDTRHRCDPDLVEPKTVEDQRRAGAGPGPCVASAERPGNYSLQLMPSSPPDGSFHVPDDHDAAILRVANPLLDEVVNFGLVLHARVANLPGQQEHQLAVHFLYRQVLDLADAFRLLVRELAAGPGRLQLRAAFEAVLGLEWIAKENSERRGIAYLVGDTLTQIAFWERIAESSIGTQLPDAFSQMMASLTARLQRPGWAASHQEFIAERGRRRKQPSPRWWPPWYSLYGGPSDIAGLAVRCGRSDDYDRLYRHWSQATHATDVVWQMKSAGDGLRPLRSPILLAPAVGLAVEFATNAMKLTLHSFGVSDGQALFQQWLVRAGINARLRLLELMAPDMT